MMTIKQFAELCNCTTQTLRYYDKIGLLKPVTVDQWSGYRYYAKAQAVSFVKIKNLQAADFSIEEIKGLLTKPDYLVYEAFDKKIVEQEQKLAKIKKIQQSYLTEKNAMEKLIQGMTGFIMSQLSDLEGMREFGMDPKDCCTIFAQVEEYLQQTATTSLQAEREISLVVNDEIVRGADSVAKKLELLKGDACPDTLMLGDSNLSEKDRFDPQQYDTLWETRGWQYVREFIDQIPALKPGYEYCFYFLLNKDKFTKDISFPMFMLCAILARRNLHKVNMGCSVERSTDEQNYFALMCKKK